VKDNKHNERIYYNENGMIIPHSEKAEHIIWELEYEMYHSRNCGYTCSDMKKRLWDIKMKVDKALKNAPVYHGDPNYEELYLIEKIKDTV